MPFWVDTSKVVVLHLFFFVGDTLCMKLPVHLYSLKYVSGEELYFTNNIQTLQFVWNIFYFVLSKKEKNWWHTYRRPVEKHCSKALVVSFRLEHYDILNYVFDVKKAFPRLAVSKRHSLSIFRIDTPLLSTSNIKCKINYVSNIFA